MFTQDSKGVIERYKTGFEPPGDIAFEDLDSPQQQQQDQGTPKVSKAAKGTVKEKSKSRGGAKPKVRLCTHSVFVPM